MNCRPVFLIPAGVALLVGSFEGLWAIHAGRSSRVAAAGVPRTVLAS